jgi:hypothetical protein
MYGHVLPQDWVREAVDRVGNATNDATIGLKIRYKGTQAAAHITIAATTNDFVFEQGASTALANTTTGTNPTVGATTGRIDLSSSTVSTFSKLVRQINNVDWEAWLVDVPPDLAVEVSAGNGKFLPVTDQDCTVAAGYSCILDTSLMAKEAFFAGLTFNGPSTTPHSHDGQVLHEILQIKAKAGFGTNACSIDVIECDDVNGTAAVVKTYPYTVASQGTTITLGTGDEPYISTQNKRLVVRITGGSATTAAGVRASSISIIRRSMAIGPGVRKDRMVGNQQ